MLPRRCPARAPGGKPGRAPGLKPGTNARKPGNPALAVRVSSAVSLNKTTCAESHPTFPMSFRHILLFTLSALAVGASAAESKRFSQTLTAEQRTVTGVEQLNSDQVAALDALVRLNLNQAAADAQKAERAKSTAAEPATTPAPTQPVAFSQWLSPDQRRAAGFEALSAEQQAQIDALVAAQTPGAPLYEPAAPKPVEAVEFFPNRFEVHGEVGLSLGFGSGGYNSRAAWVTSSLLDTKTGTEVSVTVASGREKWKRGYPCRYDWDDVSFGLSAPLFSGR